MVDRITVEPGKMSGQPCIRGVKFLIDNNISRGICLCREPGGHEAADRPTLPSCPEPSSGEQQSPGREAALGFKSAAGRIRRGPIQRCGRRGSPPAVRHASTHLHSKR